MAGKAEVAKIGGVKAEAVEGTIKGILELVRSGKKVTLHGLGTFDVIYRKPRMGRNPQTGEEAPMEERPVLKLEVNKELRQELYDDKALLKLVKQKHKDKEAAKKARKEAKENGDSGDAEKKASTKTAKGSNVKDGKTSKVDGEKTAKNKSSKK
ncbi:TPA: hypothetical protein DIC62_00350 [Candidatus Nomurabacteria bacterium]|nr:hypothetical protein [Candidatus Nomurabacteria bacterium]